MAAEVMLKVDGVAIPNPSRMEWGLYRISAPDAGRSQTGKMYFGLVTTKQQLTLGWNMPTPEDTATILNAFLPEYINVEYVDPLTNASTTKEFTVGDMTAPVQQWFDGGKRYTSVSFTITER